MLSLAPNFAVPRHDERKSLVHLFWYAEPFRYSLDDLRNVHPHIGKHRRVGRKGVVERLPQEAGHDEASPQPSPDAA